jgi:hypothetical protein
MDHGTHDRSNGSRWTARLVFIAFAGAAAYFLITEHRAHLSGILPWALLLTFPLLHIFMHRGHSHGGHGDRGGYENSERSSGETGSNAQQPGPDAHRH